MSCLKSLLFALVLAPLPSLAADRCEWLEAAAIDAALPEYAPWALLYGSDQGCSFHGQREASFGASVVVKESPRQALAYVRELRGSVAQPVAAPVLGDDAYSYRPPADATDPAKTVFFVAPSKKAVLMIHFTTPEPLTADSIEAAATLARASLAVGRDRETVAAALECRWLDPRTTRALLGRGYDQQSYEGGCIATGKQGFITVAVAPGEHHAVHNASVEGLCSTEAAPALGDGALVAWSCREQNPHVRVRRLVGDRSVEYAYFPPQGEPSAAQRAQLVEVAAKAR
jgi:hypothetical protein